MKFLMLILSVMSFLVETKNSVKPEGTWPYDMEAVYSCSYQKGTVRKDDRAVLTVTGLGGVSIQKVCIWVKSNKQSGAGKYIVTANKEQIAQGTISHRDLTGDGNTFVSWDLYSGECADVDELSVIVDGTENSLYIEQYEITWSTASPHSVTLMNGYAEYTVMTERSGGSGIVLPLLPDTAEWRFMGWSEKEIRATTQTPTILAAYSKYFPREDTYLWALYKQHWSQEPVYMTEPVSGVYLYVNRYLQTALSGVPEKGIMQPAALNSGDENQHYEITFASPDTAYIRHAATNTPIGYEGTQLAVKVSPWQIYHDGEETLFYTTVKQKTYVLWLNIPDRSGDNYHAGLLDAPLGTSPVALQAVPEQGSEPLYSCHPENPQGISPVTTSEQSYSIPFGIYELRITNGQKQLIIR